MEIMASCNSSSADGRGRTRSRTFPGEDQIEVSGTPQHAPFQLHLNPNLKQIPEDTGRGSFPFGTPLLINMAPFLSSGGQLQLEASSGSIRKQAT